MTKVAKLVYVSLLTRVVVDENASEEDIIDASRLKFVKKINEELGENIEMIQDDTECPYEEGEEEFGD